MEKKIGLILFLVCFITVGAPSLNIRAEEEESYVNLKIQEIHFKITPSFKFILPDGAAKIEIKNKFDITELTAATEYSYIYSKIKYLLGYRVLLPFEPSLILYDDTNFERVYEAKKFIQRNRGIGVGLKSPAFFDTVTIKENIRNENFYFAQLNNVAQVEQGNMNVFDSWIEIARDFEKAGAFKLSLNLEKGLPTTYAKYNYLFFNGNLSADIRPHRRSLINLNLSYGYLLEGATVSQWKAYGLGGYDDLAGFNVDEFSGYYKLFGRVKYTYAFLEKINWNFWVVTWSGSNLIAEVNIGNVGDVWSLMKGARYKISAAIGLDMDFKFKYITNFRLTFMLAQALSGHAGPVFYLINEF